MELRRRRGPACPLSSCGRRPPPGPQLDRPGSESRTWRRRACSYWRSGRGRESRSTSRRPATSPPPSGRGRGEERQRVDRMQRLVALLVGSRAPRTSDGPLQRPGRRGGRGRRRGLLAARRQGERTGGDQHRPPRRRGSIRDQDRNSQACSRSAIRGEASKRAAIIRQGHSGLRKRSVMRSLSPMASYLVWSNLGSGTLSSDWALCCGYPRPWLRSRSRLPPRPGQCCRGPSKLAWLPPLSDAPAGAVCA